MKPIVIVLYGKSSAGKDTTAKRLTEAYQKIGVPVNNVVSYTTRSPRDGEIDGIDYHFTDVNTFVDMKYKGEFIESTKFRGWHYGTSFDSFKPDCVNICVMNLRGVETLFYSSESTFNTEFFYLDVPFHIRLLRSIKREHKFKFEYLRRAFVDWIDFHLFHDDIYNIYCFHRLKYKKRDDFTTKIMNTDYLIYLVNELKRTI